MWQIEIDSPTLADIFVHAFVFQFNGDDKVPISSRFLKFYFILFRFIVYLV